MLCTPHVTSGEECIASNVDTSKDISEGENIWLKNLSRVTGPSLVWN